jgi:hypothetical protein
MKLCKDRIAARMTKVHMQWYRQTTGGSAAVQDKDRSLQWQCQTQLYFTQMGHDDGMIHADSTERGDGHQGSQQAESWTVGQ